MTTHKVHLVLTAVGAVGIVALVLPFTFGVSPHQAMDGWGRAGRIALPAYLSVFITVASVRWMRRGRLSPVADGIAYVLAAGSAVATLSLYPGMDWPPQGPLAWFVVLAPLAVLLFGAVVLAGSLRRDDARRYAPILALQVAYIAAGMLALSAFFPDWQVGAFAVLTTMIAYAIQIDLVRKGGSGRQADGAS